MTNEDAETNLPKAAVAEQVYSTSMISIYGGFSPDPVIAPTVLLGPNQRSAPTRQPHEPDCSNVAHGTHPAEHMGGIRIANSPSNFTSRNLSIPTHIAEKLGETLPQQPSKLSQHIKATLGLRREAGGAGHACGGFGEELIAALDQLKVLVSGPPGSEEEMRMGILQASIPPHPRPSAPLST
jgi:hypothetical protein